VNKCEEVAPIIPHGSSMKEEAPFIRETQGRKKLDKGDPG